MTREQVKNDLQLSSATMSKFSKSENVSMAILDKLCEYLDCRIEDILLHEKEFEQEGYIMQELEQKLLNDFDVTMTNPILSSINPPTVTLTFNNEQTISIYHKLITNGTSFYKAKAEGFAKMNNWVPPFQIIKSISTINTAPYTIEICAVEPLIFSFVLALLKD